MNRKFLNTSALKAMSIAATAAILLTSAPSVTFAHDMKAKPAMHITDEQVSVKYVGTTASNYTFNIQFENASQQKFTVIIKNDDGVVVYQEQFTDAHFAKNFLLPTTENYIRPTFIIRSGNSQVERTFEVSTTLTPNVVVTKL